MNWSQLNPLAGLIVVVAAGLAVLGEVDAREVMVLLTGLAIPARAAGYQTAE
jgi:hypothetical protein